jgi:hypothetical protein
LYDLKFDEAHHQLARWQQARPDDSLGPASDARFVISTPLRGN